MRRRLIEIFIQQANRDAALAHVSALPNSVPNLEAFRSAVRGACFAVQENLIAAKAYLQAGYSHGCRDPICLKWFALCLIATGDRAAARPILEAWKQIDPRNQEVDRLLANAGSTAPGTPDLSRRIDSPVGSSQPIKLNLPAWTPAPTQR